MANQLLEYARNIGVGAESTLGLVEMIHAGLPFRAFERLRENMELSGRELAATIQITPRTLTRRKAAGILNPDESDRLLRTTRVYGKAVDLFEGDRDAALAWFKSPKRALGGKRPLELTSTDVGAKEVENLIDRLEHGVFI